MTSMEHEAIKLAPSVVENPPPQDDLDLEEGEVTDESEEGYTPLPRPELGKPTEFAGGASVSQPRTGPMEIPSDQDDDLNDDDDSDADSDDSDVRGSFVKRMRGVNDQKLRVKPPLDKLPHPQLPPNQQRLPSKYNIWAESLQEDTLMENMRGCDVTLNGMRNRDVESYDYNLKYRMANGTNAFHRSLKRRQSNSDDSDGYGGGKRFRSASFGSVHRKDRISVKQRLGKRNSSDSNSNDSFQNAPRHILDLKFDESFDNQSFASELAKKLCEEKDDLMLRIVNVLGKEIPVKLFKETQKIEADGGMLIMNGARRRTPGGVFLFLLKHNEEIDKEDKKSIFLEDKKATIKERKNSQAINREKKVEELKKTLNRQVAENELPTRSDLMMSHLKPETHNTLSNPPPSPVGDENREGSPDFEPQNVHLNVTSPEKPQASDKRPGSPAAASGFREKQPPELLSYDDDCLDMTCDDMDLF
ncbi:phosphorylated adapter RNA export protein isoform X2 [Uranotaenia lowii]|uniref:phosphorylated adapter RNA export protein isoform X2 n=1 Tax=Uranotaenia lowii TaxID=190385 RepID=UPI0024796E0E|nr:phosphorylated adapter RNA export protein isoform X2 [Uranotaenia lowii]